MELKNAIRVREEEERMTINNHVRSVHFMSRKLQGITLITGNDRIDNRVTITNIANRLVMFFSLPTLESDRTANVPRNPAGFVFGSGNTTQGRDAFRPIEFERARAHRWSIDVPFNRDRSGDAAFVRVFAPTGYRGAGRLADKSPRSQSPVTRGPTAPRRVRIVYAPRARVSFGRR